MYFWAGDLPSSLARLVHYSPRSGQTRVAIDAAAAAACTIAVDRDRGSICIHCDDDDDPRVAVAASSSQSVHLVFGGMQHAKKERTTDCKWRRWISTGKGERGH